MQLSEAKAMKHPPDNLVWYSILDDKYVVTVTRPGKEHVLSQNGYVGIFEIFNALGHRLYTEEVGLSYGARFGPDVADVDEWQTKAIDFIDKQ
jgi:hypothetical protein